MKWEMIRLGDVLQVIAGQSPPSSTYNNDKIGLPFFQGKADFGVHYPKVRIWCNAPNKVALPDDILLSVRAPVGPTNICNIESCIGRGLAAIRSNDKTDAKFVYYFFKQIEPELSQQGNGSTFSAITADIVRNLSIPLPPLPIQQKIAAILDAADTLRQKDKALLQHYDALLQSTFHQLFGDPVKNEKGWKVVSFKDISILSQGLQIPIRNRLTIKAENSYPYITNQYINGNKVVEYINNPKQNVICTYDDVLMTRTGNTGIVLTDVEGVFHNNFFKIDYNRELVNKKYLVHFLQQPRIKWEVLRRASTTTIPDLNHGDFYSLSFLLPPLPLQNYFAAIAQKIQQQKALVKVQATYSEALFQSLLHRAFSGEIE